MKLIQFSLPLPLCAFGNQKHLVESCGELYVVDRFFDRERRFDHDLRRYRVCPKTVNFEVYKLDQEWGRWVMVKNLGDHVFFFWVKTVPSLFQLQNSLDVKGIAFTSLIKMTLVSSTLRIRRLARL